MKEFTALMIALVLLISASCSRASKKYSVPKKDVFKETSEEKNKTEKKDSAKEAEEEVEKDILDEVSVDENAEEVQSKDTEEGKEAGIEEKKEEVIEAKIKPKETPEPDEDEEEVVKATPTPRPKLQEIPQYDRKISNPNLPQPNISPASIITAAKKSTTTTIQTLLDMGLDINYKNSRGESALSAAIKANRINIIRFLLDKGADTTGLKVPELPPLPEVSKESPKAPSAAPAPTPLSKEARDKRFNDLIIRTNQRPTN